VSYVVSSEWSEESYFRFLAINLGRARLMIQYFKIGRSSTTLTPWACLDVAAESKDVRSPFR